LGNDFKCENEKTRRQEKGKRGRGEKETDARRVSHLLSSAPFPLFLFFLQLR
jgi:hypothetical protein